MIEINLIPQVKRELLKTRSLRNKVISVSILIGGASIAVVVVLAVLFGGQIATEAIQDGGIKDRADRLTSVEDVNKVVTIQNQLTKITSQHESKKINSRFFDLIAAINPAAPNNVTFSNIKVDPSSRTLTLEGSAESGYTALETLKKTILSTTIKTVKNGDTSEVALTDNIEGGETSFGENTEGKKVLQFSFSFSYPDALTAAVNDGTITIATPNTKIDVTDSRRGVPNSLFKEKANDKSDSKQEGENANR